MDEKEQDKLLELYTFAALSYEKHFKDQVDDIDDLYPEGWHMSRDYQAKIEILAYAIEKNTFIVNTPSYLNILEGVVDDSL